MIGSKADLCRCLHVRGDHAKNEGECLHDDCACDLFRAKAPMMSTGTRAIGVGRRRHKPPKVGDRVGPYRITRLIGRGYRGRSDLRVEIKCTCGRYSETYEFNLRTVKAKTCPHGDMR